jgi:tetratricopeptide (TPR) repeat protein
MGSYLRDIKVDLDGARDQFLAGLASDSNNVDLLASLSTVERALGKFEDALSHAKQAAQLDPRSVVSARRLAGAYHDLRRFTEELPAWDRALAVAPNNLALIQGKAFGYLSLGQLDSVHTLVKAKLATVDTTALLVRFAMYQETMWTLPPELWPRILTLTVKDFAGDKGHWGLKLGHTYRLVGDSAHARMFGDSARLAFETQLRDFPERAQLHELLGRALALGGHKAEAVAEAERSLALRETTLDASLRPYVHFQVARILIQSGEYDRALDLVEPLLTTYASDLTPAYLRLDPTFKPLMGNPRFQHLLSK